VRRGTDLVLNSWPTQSSIPPTPFGCGTTDRGRKSSTVSPVADGPGWDYQLTFRLPDHVESWISQNEQRRRSRTGLVMEDLPSCITVYRSSGGETQIYQLRYEPSDPMQPRA
jgi:hypothetical protein